MGERIAQVTEAGGIVALVVIWTSSKMEWLNENHFAVISIVAVITGIVTIAAAIYRKRNNDRMVTLRERELDIYETEVKTKTRRKTDHEESE